MMHVCELRDDGGYNPPDRNGTRCNSFGEVFYRDPDGWGHWLCPAHRDNERANVAEHGLSTFGEAEA